MKESKDLTMIFRIIETSFFILPVFALTSAGKIQIRVIELRKDSLLVEELGGSDKERVLFITNNGNSITIYFKIERTENKMEVLKPYRMLVVQAKRETERKEISNPVYFISSINNQNEIVKTLNFDSIKVKNLVNSYSQTAKDKLSHLDLYISDRQDIRLKLMGVFDKPIFVPNKLDPKSVASDFVPYIEYYHATKGDIRFDKYHSEICIPLKFRNFISFGYLAGYNEKIMDNSHYNLMNIITSSLRKDLLTSVNILESRDRAVVNDISKEGFSFDHPNNTSFSKIFIVGSIILFDFFITETEKFSLRAVVRNIRPTDKSFRIGCQFYAQYPEEKKILSELIQYAVV
ncbi:MAG: PilZ domain-containing protein [Leptospiraceae bacterium]|nr:PilZ domain-containing protein [Leptospiraceae bacterium]